MALLGPSASRALRPTRRDVILVVLSLAFALLFLTPSHHPNAAAPRPSSKSGGRFGKWGSILGPSQAHSVLREPSFEETVQPAGFVSADGVSHDDAAESDEFADKATVMLGHTPGWTMFERVYIYNGQMVVVTDKRDDWPELRLMTSTGLPSLDEPGNIEAREPIGNEIIFMTPAEAHELWGNNVERMRGMTWLWNDGQFLDHYYHFAAEILLSSWRVHAAQDSAQNIDENGHSTTFTPPDRIWMLHQNSKEWRDRHKFNAILMYALFPNIGILYPEDWDDIKASTKSEYRKKAYVLDRAILADRSAAFRGPYTGPTQRTYAGAVAFGTASRWFWEPARRQVLRWSGLAEDIINRSQEGFGAVNPDIWEKYSTAPGSNDPKAIAPVGTYRPLVTYISRQGGRRSLTKDSHEDLLKAIKERQKTVDFEFLEVDAEKLSKEEQFSIAGRTTIMLGVHGNGLTHLLWMPPTPRSAVIELFCKGGFAHDYMWTATHLGIRHYAVQHDIALTSPNQPKVDYPEDFQSDRITVVGKVVADLIERRLAGKT
ncbi:uncharacterized protein LOC62_02G002829 [Vanrija pseudolonga]|uniref:Glycosyltransferase 61 catalytic domain-containing protein n=1 Tax=Vanrija pseudolonga TaxID=143232 RepID=A0AAF0Y986_9TREE|nr:hypothetical protein LOC62_02G002829 [Vanrija pseudolonga]